MQAALRGERDADVACAGCTACCRSYQFVHIGPDEIDTLAHIPAELLFPAPRMPKGHVLLGYDEHGRCPMLGEHGCSIYEHRPRTCRTYDCRIFAATGIEVDKPAVAERAARWRFDEPTSDDAVRRRAVRAAVTWLRDHRIEGNPTQLAVVAVEIHELFLGSEEPSENEVLAEIDRWRGTV